MDRYFSIYGMQIPVELRPLYEEVSKTFEQQVYGAFKSIGENLDEKVKEANTGIGLSQSLHREKVR